MRKLISMSILLVSMVAFVSAQMEENLLPKSFKLSHISGTEIPDVVLPDFVMSAAEQADLADVKNGTLPKFSRSINTDLSLENSGAWTTLPDGDRIWRVKITSAGALALIPLFDKLYLPEGALLHVYMPLHEEIMGAYTHSNTPEPRGFCAGIIHGETCIVEYFEPANQTGKGIVSIKEVGHAYRWISPLKDANAASASGTCEVNVACSEAAPWADEVRGVARILVIGSGGQGFCSGTLINNVRRDCTPYFLSAQHCSEGATAPEFLQWVFYFNYQSSTCTGTTGPQNKVVNGCTKIADSNDNGGDTGSDFLLLQLSTTPSANYNVFYNGWSSTGAAPPSGICIHHPDGDIKKISTYSTAPTTTSWGGNVQDTHWNVRWATTANGHGVTEPGSSGSPLFDNQGLIIGTLTGGNSFCTSPNAADQFGRFSYDWVANGSADNLRLLPWLDPDNSGVLSLVGTNTPCGSNIQDDAGILRVYDPSGNICSSTFTPKFVLQNFGANVLHTVTVNYEIDGNVYQYDWTGNLAAGGTTTIALTGVNLSPGSHSFTAETIFPNGSADNNNANNLSTTNFTILPANAVINLYLKTDSYGSETTWDIKDGSNNTVASGGPYGNVENGETMNIPVCIAPGCYTFTLRDSYGDGMNDGGNSNMQLTANGGAPVLATLLNKNFGHSEVHNFCVTASGIEETGAVNLRVVPNPSNGIFNVSFDTETEKTVAVIDAIGRVISQSHTLGKNFAIDLSNRAKGIYLLQVETKEGRVVRKLVVE